MARQSDAALAALARPLAEALIPAEDVRRAREVDGVIRGGQVRADRLSGPLPPNSTGVVQAQSVQAPAIAESDSLNVAGQLADLDAALGLRLANPLTEDGAIIVGGPGGTAQQLVRGPDGAILGVLGGILAWYTPEQLGLGTTSDQGQLVITIDGVGHSLEWDGDPLYWNAPAAQDRTFRDDEFVIVDDADGTKRLRFQASGITTGTERTVTLPDKSGTLAMLDDLGGGGGAVATVSDTATVDLVLAAGDLSANVLAAGIGHQGLSGAGTNDHAAIDAHIADSAIHGGGGSTLPIIATGDLVVGVVSGGGPVNRALSSLGAVATASSADTAQGDIAADAIDGSDTTYWQAGAAGPDQWLAVDLGQVYTVTGWRILGWTTGEYWVTSFKIQISDDGVAWTDHVTGLAQPAADASADLASPVATRYIRFYATAGPTNTWIMKTLDVLTTEVGSIQAARLPVGANGEVVVADSTAAQGLDWRALTKGDVGLGNVDNTSDLAKPISTATQTALAAKLAIADVTTVTVAVAGPIENSSTVTWATHLSTAVVLPAGTWEVTILYLGVYFNPAGIIHFEYRVGAPFVGTAISSATGTRFTASLASKAGGIVSDGVAALTFMAEFRRVTHATQTDPARAEGGTILAICKRTA